MLAENQYKDLHQIRRAREDLSQKKLGCEKPGPGRPPPLDPLLIISQIRTSIFLDAIDLTKTSSRLHGALNFFMSKKNIFCING